MHRTGPNRQQNLGPARATAGVKPACFLRCVVGSSSAVIGAGAHVTVAMVDSASENLRSV